MDVPAVHVVDFETKGIQARPEYPPKPVGVSIKEYGSDRIHYYSWGHPSNNNCDQKGAERALAKVWNSRIPLLFQHAKFDYDVGTTFMGMPKLPWERIHDTLYLIYLEDPHAETYSLKPAAQRFLRMSPKEQAAVRQWLIDHQIVRKDDRHWGARIAEAPGDIVGRYADGDVLRTERLFKYLYPRICKAGMQKAYDTERELMPILLENERQGIRVDVRAMRRDLRTFDASLERADQWLRKRLKAPDLNVDSDHEVSNLLDKHGIVTDWVMTKTGKKSTAKKNLTLEMFHDKKVAAVLGYRNRLTTCLGTFMRPWLIMSQEHGRIYTNWNQVRQNTSRNDLKGARTGRLSSNPNFQNIPKNFYDKDDGYVHPTFLTALPELPLMRNYVLPDLGHLFGHRDYNQQELRILAHFEDGALCKAYNEDARLDVHDYVRDAIQRITGRSLTRRPVKIINFGIIYGMGNAKLAAGIHTTVEEARSLKKAHRQGAPDVANLEKSIKKLGREGDAIRTWGGRVYYTEPPREINGEEKTFEYKLLNYLIQGSAADCTKRALIAYNKTKRDGRFLVTVHDEMNISAPRGAMKGEMKILKEAMEAVEFDVPMLSDGKVGVSWGKLKGYKDA